MLLIAQPKAINKCALPKIGSSKSVMGFVTKRQMNVGHTGTCEHIVHAYYDTQGQYDTLHILTLRIMYELSHVTMLGIKSQIKRGGG